MNRTIKNLLLGFFVLTAFQTCRACRLKASKEENFFCLSGSVKETKLFLGKKEISTLVTLNVLAKSEQAEAATYQMTSWKVSAGMKGKLTSDQGEVITQEAP